MHHYCPKCGKKMEHWGRSKAGTARFFCRVCQTTKTFSSRRNPSRKNFLQLQTWLRGKASLREVADQTHQTRQALWKKFRLFWDGAPEPHIPLDIPVKVLILDGTYVHGHTLCALISVDEQDRIFWRFAPYESYTVWLHFLASFPEPEVVVMDGQKGLFAAARRLWPRVPIQRCQFHVIAFAVQYVGRRPREKAGKDLLHILYTLKEAKTPEGRDRWMQAYRAWEKRYEIILGAKNALGRFHYPRLRSARLIIRRALPYLFTFLDHPGAPNTTNLIEGWINGTIAEALRLHRGLRSHEKKLLVSVILSHLTRAKKSLKVQAPLAS